MVSLVEIYSGISLRLLLEDSDGYTRDARGRFARIGSRSVFVPRDTPGPEAFDRLKPPDRAPESDKSKVTYNTPSGPVERAVYSDEWLRRTSAYKFAKVLEIERKREQIEGELESELKAELKKKAPPSFGFAVAAAALLIARTGLRPGNPDQGTKKKSGPDKGKFEKTYGATTLERRHVSVRGDTINLKFVGKSGVARDMSFEDKTLAQAFSKLLRQPGGDTSPLFAFGPESRRVSEKALGERFKGFNEHFDTKDFRTAVAMSVASEFVEAKLSGGKPDIPKSPKAAKKLAISLVKELAQVVSGRLGNTPDVALKNYMNPAIVEHYLEQSGFNPAVLNEEKQQPKAPSLVPSEMPILSALFGEKGVREWAGKFLSDEDPEEGDESDD